MKVQLILLTLSLLLFSFIDSNSDKELQYSIYYYKIKKDAPKLDVSEIKFKRLPESKSLGYKNGTYWFKLVLENNSNQKNLTAYIPTHNIDKIDVYQFKNEQLNYISSTGNSISRDQLPVDYKFPAFKINTAKNAIYYLKIIFPKEANFPLKIDTEKEVLSYIMEKKTIGSFYYGTALMIIILNLFFFFKFRDTTYLFYLLFLSSLMVNFLLYDGSLIHLYRGYGVYYKLEMLIHLSNQIWFILFSVKFLNLSKNHPNFTKLFFLFPIVVAILYVGNLISNDFIFVVIADTFGILLFPILWFFGIYYFKKLPYAKFYVFGYLLLIPFAVFFIIGYPLGLWEVNGEMLIIKIASWLDIILLTYAISYRMNTENMNNDLLKLQSIDNRAPLNEQPEVASYFLSLLKTNTITTQPLTLREIDILELLCKGFNNTEISDQLFISNNTVKYHIRNIYIKSGVGNRTELKEKLSSIHSY
jgi:DNA-binding CsgD family transcriptional regulator